MDDDLLLKLQRSHQVLMEQFVNLTGLVTELRASVNVLKLHLANQIQPGDPAPVLAMLEEMEKALLKASPEEQERLRAFDLIQALKAAKKHGSPGSA